MRLTELCERAGCAVVVDLTDDDGPRPRAHEGLQVVGSTTELPRADGDGGSRDARVGAVVHATPERLATVLDRDVLERVDVVVVALHAAVPALDPSELDAAVAAAGLVVERAVPLAYASSWTGLVLVPADPGVVATAGRGAVAELAVDALRRELADARAVARTVDDLRRELDRRAARIATLSTEVTALQDRLDGLRRHGERELRARDRTVAQLRGGLAELRRSTSYRIGHALVLVVRDPRRLARAAVARLRRVLARTGSR